MKWSPQPTGQTMIGKEKMMLVAFATAIMAMVVIITSSSNYTPVFAGESDVFGGTPTNDMSSESNNEEDHNSGYDTYLGGPNNAISGFPSEERSAERLPNQGGDEVGTFNNEAASVPSKNVEADAIYYKKFQTCLSDYSGNVTPTEQEVQACLESSYGGGPDDSVSPVDSSDGNGDTQDASENADDDEDDEDSEDSEE
jgi:hypothetical protein